MSGDPLPHKSARMLVPLFDNGPANTYAPGTDPSDNQVTYRDAMNLIASGQGAHRAAVYRISLPLEPDRPDLAVEPRIGTATSISFSRAST